MFFNQVFCSIHMIVEILSSHMPVDAGPYIASIACAATIVNVKYCITIICQEIMKHEFPEITAPPLMYILQVTCTMNKYHRRR